MRVCLAVPERYAANTELPKLLAAAPADLYVFPEGFLRSPEELELALALSKDLPGAILTGCRDGDWEKALVIESGAVTDEYTKCILTAGEKAKGKRPGENIRCMNSRWGKLAVPICYELHFPEVCRIMALEKPVLMVNMIGTGMYHRLQYDQWRTLARARAIENEVPVVGCCHHCGEIPLAFAFDENGVPLLEASGAQGGFPVDIPAGAGEPIGYKADRRPELFAALCKQNTWEGIW